MKHLIVFLLAILCLAGCQQRPEGYVINGIMADQPTGKAYLKSFRNKMFFNVDSTDIVNGKFTFTGQTEQPLLYALTTDEMSSQNQFFLENAELNIVMNTGGDSFTIEGSPASNLFLANAEKVFEESYNIDNLVSTYPESPVAAFFLYRYFTYQLSLDQLKETRAKLSQSLANCPYVIDLDRIITQLEGVQISKVAPEFSLADSTGTLVSLSSFRGKYVLLDFWASWCPPCRGENPNVVKIFNEYKDKNFTIIGISLDYNRASWLKGIADDGLTWTNLSDLKYWDSEIAELYGVRGIPANYLLDPDGVIIAKNVMGKALTNTLKEYIK